MTREHEPKSQRYEEIVVYPGICGQGSEIRFSTPEQLAESGIGYHPDAVDRAFGKGAGDRYLQAMGYKPNQMGKY